MAKEYRSEIEFFRNAFILVPRKNTECYETVLIPSPGKKKQRLFCSCSVGKAPSCNHTKLLVNHYDDCIAEAGSEKIDDHFNRSVPRLVFGNISRIRSDTVSQLSIVQPAAATAPLVIVAGKMPVIVYHSAGNDRERLISRIEPKKKFSRAWLLDRSASFVESEYERAMRISGHRTVRMLEEGSLWYRFAYHCYMEFREMELQWGMDVDKQTGEVRLHAKRDDAVIFTVLLPEKSVPGVIDTLKRQGTSSLQWGWVDKEFELQFMFSGNGSDDVTVTPVIETGTVENKLFVPVHSRFCYGSLGYLPDCDKFYRFSGSSLQRLAAGWSGQKVLRSEDVSSFIKANRAALSIGFTDDFKGTEPEQIDLFGVREFNDLKRIAHPPLVTAFDRIELHPKSVKGSQWTIDLTYRAGEISIKLSRLLDAQQHKDEYCLAGDCIVDMSSKAVTGALAQARGIGAEGVLSLSSMSLMLLRGSFDMLQFNGDEKLTKKLKKMFSGKPRKEAAVSENMHCTLRTYQNNGVSWLLFLYDYYLGGLLCDEMGLGKTVQVLTFINIVKEQHSQVSVCIVCPTSVISHWITLVSRFSPSLRVVDYTKERKIPPRTGCDIVLLSYGIMRNDIEALERRNFDIIVFDEIQQLKNRDTAGYRAACRLHGRTAIGLTGTPVENSAEDLLALFNLVLPGLSIDIPSETALLHAVDSQIDVSEITRFRRRIEPFIMRRCKADVLTELPLKTEENRICGLSPYQKDIYCEALINKGKPLLQALMEHDAPIPYMHIFSLMTFLKQLCNTPALAAGKWNEYMLYESGKWELFKELLDESLGSGEKVVIFTQFLDMVEIFKHYLQSINVDFEALTGNSKHRDRIIKRFTEDDNCKVFIGSLKAGGVGIDLIAASVVIHYDRWWNAAREDQATDRVHRFGQKRGVQVFKLVTENTLEERIDRIIERKKNIAQITLTEDDPESVKHFTRDELIDLLTIQ